MKNLAIIPVRTGSKRVPNKNIKLFHGKPMFIHTVEHAIESNLFSKIHVSTESNEVVQICKEYGLEVDFLRPVELAEDHSDLNDVCKYVINKYNNDGLKFNNFCLLWATAPLRNTEDIINAYRMLDSNFDAVVGVSSYDLPVSCAQKISDDGILEKIFPEEFWLSSKDIPKRVCDNGSLCWTKISIFEKVGNWLPNKSKGYEMPKERSVDIDTYFDWALAEFLYEKNLENNE